MRTHFLVTLCLLLVSLSTCKDNTGVNDPNYLGGDTDIPLTKPGNKVGAYLKIDNVGINTQDSLYIASNNNGVVITRGWIKINAEDLRKLDTTFGTTAIPLSFKYALIASVLGPGAVIDTSKPDEIKISIELKSKITSAGIQDYRYSGGNESKPFTLVKYEDPVGSVYSFTDSTGRVIQRTVSYKADKEDWGLGFLMVKSIRVDETVTDNPAYSKLTYITNHKFGMIGTLVTMKNGKVFNLTFVPWAVV